MAFCQAEVDFKWRCNFPPQETICTRVCCMIRCLSCEYEAVRVPLFSFQVLDTLTRNFFHLLGEKTLIDCHMMMPKNLMWWHQDRQHDICPINKTMSVLHNLYKKTLAQGLQFCAESLQEKSQEWWRHQQHLRWNLSTQSPCTKSICNECIDWWIHQWFFRFNFNPSISCAKSMTCTTLIL